MNNAKYKAGDILICVEPENYPKKQAVDPSYPKGRVWKEELRFEVKDISSTSKVPIYWGGLNGYGVYECAVSLLSNYRKRKPLTVMALAIKEAVAMVRERQ